MDGRRRCSRSVVTGVRRTSKVDPTDICSNDDCKNKYRRFIEGKIQFECTAAVRGILPLTPYGDGGRADHSQTNQEAAHCVAENGYLARPLRAVDKVAGRGIVTPDPVVLSYSRRICLLLPEIATLAMVFVLGVSGAQAQGMFTPYYYAPSPGIIALGNHSLNCRDAPLPYPYNRDARRGQETPQPSAPAPGCPERRK
jgi:hypothetical protein